MDQNQLRKTMAALGLSQAMLAALLQVTPRAVSLWLSGDRSVPGPADAYLNLFGRLGPQARQDELDRVMKETVSMREGMYLLEFASRLGSGAGTLTLEAGRVYGFDAGNGVYDGTYDFDPTTGTVTVNMEVRMPAGQASVLGPAQPFDWTLKVKTHFHRDWQGEIVAQTDLGAVKGKLRFMRSLPVAA